MLGVILLFVILLVVILLVIMLGVIMLGVILLVVILLAVILLVSLCWVSKSEFVMPSVIILSVSVFSVVILNFLVPFCKMMLLKVPFYQVSRHLQNMAVIEAAVTTIKHFYKCIFCFSIVNWQIYQDLQIKKILM
jgi:hypothetical protein